MSRSFKGTISLDVCKSKPDWDAFLDTKAPKDARLKGARQWSKASRSGPRWAQDGGIEVVLPRRGIVSGNQGQTDQGEHHP